MPHDERRLSTGSMGSMHSQNSSTHSNRSYQNFAPGEEDEWLMIEGEGDRGLVFFRPPDGGFPVKLYDRRAGSDELRVHADTNISTIEFDFNGKLSEINNLSP